MALSSMRFAFDERLKQVSENNPTMKRGETGEAVEKVQGALVDLGYAMPVTTNHGRRSPDGIFGSETEAVVRQYQKTEGLSPDGIVGRFTLASLDEAMRDQEQSMVSNSGFAGQFLGSMVKAPAATKPKINMVIVTETNAPWVGWARQIKKHLGPFGADAVEIPNGASVSTVTSKLKQAALKAGSKGILVMSVGHGGVIDTLSTDEGFFDLGPSGSFRLGGKNAILPGDPVPSGKKVHTVRASAFYDERIPNKALKGGFVPSRKDEDEKNPTGNAKIRLDNFNKYMDVCSTFKQTNLACVVLLTCKVGLASGFLKRVRSQWGTPIVGYNRRVMGQQQESGRTRVFLEGDAPGTGTNIVFGEFFVPLGQGMVVIN